MDKAFNKNTSKTIDAIEIFKDGSYQETKKYEWIAPTDSIKNWDDLDKLNMKEVNVHYVSPKRWVDKKGKKRVASSCFAVYPNSPAKTVGGESEEHHKLKDWLFERLEQDDLKLLYSQGTKPHRYKNFVKLSELEIDWSNYQIPEETIRSTNKIRADILLPFISKDDFFGNGIIFEIQLCEQKEEKVYERTIDRILKGYSVVWVYAKDFFVNEDGLEINEELKMYPFAELLNKDGKLYIEELKKTVENQCRFIDEKIELLQKKNIEIDNYNLRSLDETKKQIDVYFNHKINELTKDFNEIIANKVQESFFTKNEEKINRLITNNLPLVINKDIIETIIGKCEPNKILEEARVLSLNKVYPKIRDYNIYREFISNPPKCSGCGSRLVLSNGDYGLWLRCPNYPDCKQKNSGIIPDEIRNMFSKNDKDTIY